MGTNRTLRAGVFLPPFHPNDEDPLLCMERDFQLMQWLDAHNYAEAWIGEHHSGGYEIYGQPELFIATAAERTRYIRLGTGVISLPTTTRSWWRTASPARLSDAWAGHVRLRPGLVALGRDDARPRDPTRPHG